MKRVLFVCLGNICRSPTAEAVFKIHFEKRKIAAQVDSAGTSAYHIGQKSDSRSIFYAENAGYSMNHLARQFTEQDFDRFDLIFVMDKRNLESLRRCALQYQKTMKQVYLLSDFSSMGGYSEVPDPYYGGEKEFKEVIELIESCVEGVIEKFFRN